jgi:tetratricopeptide (TPR) repeat protein
MKDKYRYPLSLFKIGKEKEAISLLNRIAKNDNDAEAYRYMSEYFLKKKNTDNAIECIFNAITLSPDNYYYLFICGLIYDELNQFDRALSAYKSAIKIKENYLEAYVNSSIILRKLKKYDEALKYIENSLKINSKLSIIYANRAQINDELSKYEESLRDFDIALSLEDQNPEIYVNKAKVFLKMEKYEEALNECEKSISINKHYFPAFNNKVIILKEMGNFIQALDLVEHLIIEYPNSSELYFNKGNIEGDLNNNIKAIDSYEKSIELNPVNELACMNIATIYSKIRDYEMAIQYYDRALGLNDKYFDAEWNKCVTLLTLCRYNEAIVHYDARWFISDISRPSRLDINIPLWDFKSECNNLLIYSEQGIGDIILYLRYILMVQKYVNNIWIKLDKRLASLVKRSYSNINIINDLNELKEIKISHYLPIGDLLKIGLYKSNYIFVANNYLHTNKFKTMEILNNISEKGKLICGITWHSNNSLKNKNKNIDICRLLSSLKKLDNLKFISLQYHPSEEELINIRNVTGIDVLNYKEIDNFIDIDNHASLIEACDILVLICNTTAHLAGAIGKKTYLLRGRGRGVLWYWENQKFGISNWYPSISIFPSTISTQLTDDEYWDNAIEEVRSRIGEEM